METNIDSIDVESIDCISIALHARDKMIQIVYILLIDRRKRRYSVVKAPKQ